MKLTNVENDDRNWMKNDTDHERPVGKPEARISRDADIEDIRHNVSFAVAGSTFGSLAFMGIFCTCLWFICCRTKRNIRINHDQKQIHKPSLYKEGATMEKENHSNQDVTVIIENLEQSKNEEYIKKMLDSLQTNDDVTIRKTNSFDYDPELELALQLATANHKEISNKNKSSILETPAPSYYSNETNQTIHEEQVSLEVISPNQDHIAWEEQAPTDEVLSGNNQTDPILENEKNCPHTKENANELKETIDP